MPLAECRRRVSSTEFLLWRQWFEHEWTVSREKWEYYAASVLCALSGKGGLIRNHLLPFGESAISPEQRMQRSKDYWRTLMSVANINAARRQAKRKG